MLLPSLRKENLAYTAASLRTQGWDSSLPVVRLQHALRQAGKHSQRHCRQSDVWEEFLSPKRERGAKYWRNRAGVCVCLLKGKDVLFYSFEEITGREFHQSRSGKINSKEQH